ncbi:hypothetical protein TNCV_517871 [Trichonephila clavipes]|nr:hypothetical protein TNCV_517871 [Trichonephila clavipes]
MRTRGDRDEYPIAPYTTTKFMGQYDDDECNLPMRIHQDVTKHGCDYLDAVNRTCIHLKKMTSRHLCAHFHR